jgi:hypothetical protein
MVDLGWLALVKLALSDKLAEFLPIVRRRRRAEWGLGLSFGSRGFWDFLIDLFVLENVEILYVDVVGQGLLWNVRFDVCIVEQFLTAGTFHALTAEHHTVARQAHLFFLSDNFLGRLWARLLLVDRSNFEIFDRPFIAIFFRGSQIPSGALFPAQQLPKTPIRVLRKNTLHTLFPPSSFLFLRVIPHIDP